MNNFNGNWENEFYTVLFQAFLALLKSIHTLVQIKHQMGAIRDHQPFPDSSNPLASFLVSSSKSPGKWTTNPFPTAKKLPKW